MSGACNFIKNETLAQVFSVNFTKLLKTPFFTKHLWETASICITEGSNNITVNNNQSTPTEGRVKQGDEEGVPPPALLF